jgi:hypothetical protein
MLGHDYESVVESVSFIARDLDIIEKLEIFDRFQVLKILDISEIYRISWKSGIFEISDIREIDIVSLAHNVSFWAQKSIKWVSIVSGPRN